MNLISEGKNCILCDSKISVEKNESGNAIPICPIHGKLVGLEATELVQNLFDQHDCKNGAESGCNLCSRLVEAGYLKGAE